MKRWRNRRRVSCGKRFRNELNQRPLDLISFKEIYLNLPLNCSHQAEMTTCSKTLTVKRGLILQDQATNHCIEGFVGKSAFRIAYGSKGAEHQTLHLRPKPRSRWDINAVRPTSSSWWRRCVRCKLESQVARYSQGHQNRSLVSWTVESKECTMGCFGEIKRAGFGCFNSYPLGECILMDSAWWGISKKTVLSNVGVLKRREFYSVLYKIVAPKKASVII